jgi:hypothetical protein
MTDNTPITGPIVAMSLPWELLQGLHTVLPGDWTDATYEAKFLGTSWESSLVYVTASGVTFRLSGDSGDLEPADKAAAELRRAEHTAEHGPWFGITVDLRSAGTQLMTRIYGKQPEWRQPIPEAAYAEELRLFPRDDAAIPDWLRHKAGLGDAPDAAETPAAPKPESTPEPAQTPAPPSGLRRAKVFDGMDQATGAPVVDRPRLHDDEIRRVLDYLKAGPVFLFASSYDKDVYFPQNPPAVPLKFATDGTWIWSGAVMYYLEKYGLPPEPALLAHIRERDYAMPEVSDAAKEAARDLVTGRA